MNVALSFLPFLSLLSLGLLSTATAAEPLAMPAWRSLTLELPPAFVVKAELERIEPDDAPLIARPRALAPQTSRLLHLKVTSHLKWFLTTKSWLGDLWLQPDRVALQRNRLKSGKRPNLKIYRYAEDGVYRLRYRPDGKNESIPERWPLESERFYPYSRKVRQRCSAISDPYVLLILLSQAEVPGEPLCLFNKRTVYRVTLQRQGKRTIPVAYRLDDDPVQTRLEAERWLIQPVPLDPERSPEPFEFLGMEGTIEVLRDPATHLPLQFQGRVEGFPRARLSLTRVRH